MDRKETLRNVLISAGIFLLAFSLLPSLFRSPPKPPTPSDDSRATGATARTVTETAPGAGQIAARPEAGNAANQGNGFRVKEADSEDLITIGATPVDRQEQKSPDPYRMGLTISNVGATIASATLTDHAARVNSEERYELLSPVQQPGGAVFRSLAVERINIDGADVPLGDKKWSCDSPEAFADETSERASAGERLECHIDILQGDATVVRVTRSYKLPKQKVTEFRHDLFTEISVENLSAVARQIIVTHHGGVGIPLASTRIDDRAIDYGIQGAGAQHVVGMRRTFAETAQKAGVPLVLYQLSQDQLLSWVATADTYFTCTLAPQGSAILGAGNPVAQVAAVDLDGDPLTMADVSVRLITRGVSVPAGTVASFPVEVYVGEKDPRGFKRVKEYVERNYYYQISQGFGWCTFSILVELMIWLLDGLHSVVRDYGVAIVILVLIVRTLLHPITKKGQVNMVRMQQAMGEFAPKVEELKKKYGNDKARLQQEMMQLYREHNINPASQMLTCLPMVIQMPIWVALYLSLSNNIRMRHEGFFLFPWVNDLTAPDALIPFSQTFIVPLFGWHISSFNLLPILVSISMYVQQKLQPKPKPNPNMTDQQRQQQEMMQRMMPIMSVMMLLIFYNAPSGLNLYVMFSSIFGAIEQWRIRTHIKEREAAGTLHRPKRLSSSDGSAKEKKSAASGWFDRLQKMAEDARKARPQRAKPKGRH